MLHRNAAEDIETIVVELHLGSKKWCALSIYRNEDTSPAFFLDKLSTSLDRILDEYENVFIIGDININSFDKTKFKVKVQNRKRTRN